MTHLPESSSAPRLLLPLLLLGGCASTPREPSVLEPERLAASTEAAVPPGERGGAPVPLPKRDYVFVFLLTGPTKDVAAADMTEIMSGHFANMRRLSEEGLLVLAGPLGEPRADPRHRGVFVFDVPTVEDALALAASDPALQAGVLEAEAFPWRSATPLERLPALHREAERDAGPNPNPGANARSYVLARSASVDEAELDRLAQHDTVVLAGLFGGERQGTALVCLAIDKLADAPAALAAAGADATQWTAFPFFASKFLQEL